MTDHGARCVSSKAYELESNGLSAAVLAVLVEWLQVVGRMRTHARVRDDLLGGLWDAVERG